MISVGLTTFIEIIENKIYSEVSEYICYSKYRHS